MKKSYISILLAATLLSSCSMVPEYHQPTGATDAFWKSGADGTEQEAEVNKDQLVSSLSWQEFFISKQLQNVVQTALSNNKDLRTALLNVKRARATYNIQEADLYPHIDGQADITYTGDFAGNSDELYEVNLATTSYELDLFGRIQSLSQAALNDYLATEEARKSVTISLIAESANSYLQLLSDMAALELSKSTLKAQQSTYDLIQQSYDYGVATQLDLAQVRIAVEAARVNTVLYTRQVQLARNALTALLGVNNIDALVVTQGLQDISLLQEIPVGLPSQVLLKRPDIMQAEYQLREAGASIGAARAAFYPRISLTGTLGFSSENLGDLFAGGGSGAWSFLPSISIPIFNAGQNESRLEVAEIDQEIAINQYQQTIQNAFREVADELAARDTFTLQLDAQKMLVTASQDAYDLSLIRYTQGIDNFLNVLTSQRSLFTAQQDQIDIERSSLANQINLYKVLGGGLTPSS